MNAMANQAVDFSTFPEGAPDRRASLWWGIVGLITVETVVFATLVVSFYYLSLGHYEWPPAGVEDPKLLLPTINALILLSSSISMRWADRGISKDNQKALRTGLTISILLAVVFLSIKAYEYSHVEYQWDSHAYGSIVWTITGFHSAHVIALILKTVVVATLAFKGRFHEGDRLAVTVNGIYWHFVVAVWIPLYTVLYVTPHLMR